MAERLAYYEHWQHDEVGLAYAVTADG